MSALDIDLVVEVNEIDLEVDPQPVVDVVVPEPVVAAVVIPGPVGPPGPPGAVGSDAYLHTQSTPAATWTVSHPLGRYPAGSELTIDGEVVFTDITYPDIFTAVATFGSPQVGFLRLI